MREPRNTARLQGQLCLTVRWLVYAIDAPYLRIQVSSERENEDFSRSSAINSKKIYLSKQTLTVHFKVEFDLDERKQM